MSKLKPFDATTPERWNWWLKYRFKRPAVYYVGNLLRDTGGCGGGIHSAVASAAKRTEAEGRVLLTQRRLGHGRFEYLATKRSKP